jgi:hypothetical protein
MKRESSSELPTEPALSDKRPKLEALGMEGLSEITGVLESQHHIGDKPNNGVTESGATASAVLYDDIVDKSATSGGPSGAGNSSRGRGKNGGRGRRRGRDKKGHDDRNAEKAGGKRAWEGRPRGGTREEDALEVGDATERASRLPKRKVAMLIGFCGTGEHYVLCLSFNDWISFY